VNPAGQHRDRRRLHTRLGQPTLDEIGHHPQFFGGRITLPQNRSRTGAGGTVPLDGELAPLLQVLEVRAAEHADRGVQVLCGGAVVERQPPGTADDLDAQPAEDHRPAVAALVGVLGDEQVVGPLGDQRAQHQPMRGVQVLGLDELPDRQPPRTRQPDAAPCLEEPRRGQARLAPVVDGVDQLPPQLVPGACRRRRFGS